MRKRARVVGSHWQKDSAQVRFAHWLAFDSLLPAAPRKYLKEQGLSGRQAGDDDGQLR